jgi:hypothetical protein
MFQKYTLILAFFLPLSVSAQLYMESGDGIQPLNLCDCTVGPPVTPVLSIGIAAGFNLNPYYISSDTIYMYNLSNGNTTVVAVLPAFANNLVFGPNGLLYSIGTENTGALQYLYSINPATGAVVNLGEVNSFVPLGDLFFFNGELYCLATDATGFPIIRNVPLNNPNNGATLFTYPEWAGFVGSAVVNLNGTPTVLIDAANLPTGEFGIYTLDMNTGEPTLLCPNLIIGDLAAPPGYTLNCCANDAGTFASVSPIVQCVNEPVSVPHNGDEVLAPGSSLTFLLLSSNPPVLPTHVLATATTPEFNFNPSTMTTQTTYYVAAFAAPLIGGVPQWNASCKDLSVLVPVSWRPTPTVQLSAPPAPLCANGCTNITLQFTGDLPITLSWTTQSGAGPVSGTWTATATPATFTLCAPAGTSFPVGNLPLQWTGISNPFCVCE